MTATAVSVLSTSRLVSRNHSTAGSPDGGAFRAHGPLRAPAVRRRRWSAALRFSSQIWNLTVSVKITLTGVPFRIVGA